MFNSQTLVIFPCVAGCEGSRTNVESCRCRCRGINHGRIWRNEPARPIDREYASYGYGEPEREGRTIDVPQARLGYRQPLLTERPKNVFASHTSYFPKVSLKRKAARAIKHKIGLKASERELNENVLAGLKRQFAGERLDAIVSQAYSVFFARVGSDTNQPELYELYENGDIDRALEMFQVRWIIGRPKRTR